MKKLLMILVMVFWCNVGVAASTSTSKQNKLINTNKIFIGMTLKDFREIAGKFEKDHVIYSENWDYQIILNSSTDISKARNMFLFKNNSGKKYSSSMGWWWGNKTDEKINLISIHNKNSILQNWIDANNAVLKDGGLTIWNKGKRNPSAIAVKQLEKSVLLNAENKKKAKEAAKKAYKAKKKAEKEAEEKKKAEKEAEEKNKAGIFELNNCVSKTKDRWRLEYANVDLPGGKVTVEYDKSSTHEKLIADIFEVQENKIVFIRSLNYKIISIDIIEGIIDYNYSKLVCEKINNIDTLYAAYARGEVSEVEIAKKPEKKKPKKKKPIKDDDEKIIIIGSGSGFFVTDQGHVVSNDHVVGVCKKVKAYEEGKEIYLDILATDMINDIGLVKGKFSNKKYLNIKTDGAELGEDIIAFGYPLSQELSDSVKLTKGIVSSLSGLGNNISQIQIDAAIQPGNSGGPVVNMNGQVVGIASAGLSQLYMLEKAAYIPENVNFAVASQTLTAFLKAHKVKITSGPSKIYSTKELAKIGEPATIQLFCMNTMAEYEKLKKAETHADVLLDLN